MKTINRIFLLALSLVMIVSFVPGKYAEAVNAEPVIRVKLTNSQYVGSKSQLTLIPQVSYTTNLPNLILEENQAYTLKISEFGLAILKGTTQLAAASQIEIKPKEGKGPLSINGHLYLGSFSFNNENGKYVRPVNTVGLEDYLKGVVPAEMPALWNLEALKAQAVAARTYAMGYLNKIPDDTINYQVYGGYEWHERSTAAVDATGGQVIAYNGVSIGANALFSSSNGGVTESNKNVWGGTEFAYLKVKEDPFDPRSVWQWSVKKQQIDTANLDLANADAWWGITKEAEQSTVIANIKAWLKLNGYAGKDIKVTAVPHLSLDGVTSGGRVSKGSITIDFLVKEQGAAMQKSIELTDVTASKIRAIIGLDLMKSYLVDYVESPAEIIKVSGRGYGHGVGLSQYGAKHAGDNGKTYQEILAFYYNGTTLKKAYEPSESVTQPVIPDSAPVVTTPTPVTTVPGEQPAKDETAPIIVDAKASYDSITNKASLSFAVNEASKVTVLVNDQNGKVISTVVNSQDKQSGLQSFSWNAANAANGNYTFVIHSVDSSNNKNTAIVPFTKSAPKDTAAPILKNASASFNANENKVFLKYQINETAKVSISVKDSKGKTVANPASNRTVKAGIQWASWDVSKLVNGSYAIAITATDSNGNKRAAKIVHKLVKPAGKKMTGKVNTIQLNVRVTPSSSGKVLGTLKKGQTVNILSKNSSWYKIEYKNGTGYVLAKYLTIIK
ncbi:SpoIID/LytB domain-containing protein [Peribacillus sp. SCS-155]|uniref:SpoIID/LytB domain-containing protein n=1 Tax=Peribacillus sedimenti TaxID=3115297 RepID=UPI003906255F